MFDVETNEPLFKQWLDRLDSALISNPAMERRVRKDIREVILDVRSKVIRDSGDAFKNGDPRGTRRAIRTSVYKQILGANINIYQSHKSHGTISYFSERTLRPGQRGGNRVQPSDRTIQLQSYPAEDRGFILRFVNSGTDGRYIGGRNGKTEADKIRFILNRPVTPHGAAGWRGKITATNWFKDKTEPQMVESINELATLIDEEINKALNN